MFLKIFATVSFLLSIISITKGQLLEGIYCGKENCYDVLGVSREAAKNEIAKNYRQLARKYHPDLHRDPEAKAEAEEKFKIIANAYEILKDDESRTDYDYMLDNPNEYYAHYYRYYRRRVAPKVDVRIVIFVTISIISIIQYYSAWQRYDTAIKYFMTVPKYRNRALEIAQQQGFISQDSSNRKVKGKSKSEVKEEQEAIIRMVIEEKMDIKGAYAKPTYYDILWIQLILSPYTLAKYFLWNVQWIWNHTILKKPYNEEEKLYIIRKFFKMGQHQFDSIEDHEKEDYLKNELWIWDHFKTWQKEKEETMKKQLAENSRLFSTFKMCTFEEFLKCLYKYLIGSEKTNNNVIKKHMKRLEELGEFSFSPNLPQFKQSNSLFLDINFPEKIVKESKHWRLLISKCSLIENFYYLRLDRTSTFQSVIRQILQDRSNYGSQELRISGNIKINTDCDSSTNLNLTQLRIVLLGDVLQRLLKFNKCPDTLPIVDIYLTHKSNNSNRGKVILCAPVQCTSDTNIMVTAEEFYNKRSIDMRLMAEHKYGLRVISNVGWQEMFNKLGKAAVAIELLQIKTNRPVVCKLNDPSSCSKGASFILYNCARLSTLLKEFEKKVEANIYPGLPRFDDIDFALLTQPEEWELLYVYLLQFPSVVQSCINEIMQNDIKVHNLCHALTSMCLTFSVYYQRVRILTEPRSHLFATLHARIHLVICIKYVLENALGLLNIEPVTQM
ncbi:hypothetical protein FQR65_LT04112 [Abscondita terminalis]|nr:hypothetical protein FQR65_LT04112 [Abscondita terminalis]